METQTKLDGYLPCFFSIKWLSTKNLGGFQFPQELLTAKPKKGAVQRGPTHKSTEIAEREGQTEEGRGYLETQIEATRNGVRRCIAPYVDYTAMTTHAQKESFFAFSILYKTLVRWKQYHSRETENAMRLEVFWHALREMRNVQCTLCVDGLK